MSNSISIFKHTKQINTGTKKYRYSYLEISRLAIAYTEGLGGGVDTDEQQISSPVEIQTIHQLVNNNRFADPDRIRIRIF
jgi:hypothetical protein